MANQRNYQQLDLSGAVQARTSHILRKQNEVYDSVNARFDEILGAAVRRSGYEQTGRTIQHLKDNLGGGIFAYGTNHKIVVGINNANDSNAKLRYLDTGDWWQDIITDAAPNTYFDLLNHLDELYVAGKSESDEYLTLRNVDETLTPSTTRNVMFAPKAAFITEFAGSLYAINCEVRGVKYPDRAYKSSPPLGAVSFVNTDQKGLFQQLRVDSVKFIKPGMTIDIYGAGTEAKKVDSLAIISVDKKNNRISFQATQIDVADNDEIWLEDRKGKLTHFWNTDHPTPEDSDFLRVPPGRDNNPEFTGYTKNNNRLFLFTNNSFLKWDGANLITISESIGCVAHKTIRNIGSWTLWLHSSGVWGYNDNTGQLILLSRSINKYIRAINQGSLKKATAVVINNIYKLAVGELLDVDFPTTSTSTSSTSTSSTSSSTSSTSTSSTSTSSTSTSTTISTTSTSTTSVSTSTTSTSTTTVTTSTSTSTSSTSTSTTTSADPPRVTRFIYDFDANTWWLEEHRREIRTQFVHTMHGYTKPYFFDDTGRLFRDETGNLDHTDTIPMKVRLGRNNFGNEFMKTYDGVFVDAEKAQGAILYGSIDDKDFEPIGQVTEPVGKINFKQGKRGRFIDYVISHNTKSDAPIINGVVTYYTPVETLHDGRK